LLPNPGLQPTRRKRGSARLKPAVNPTDSNHSTKDAISDIHSAVHSQFDVCSPGVTQPPLLVFSVLFDDLVRSCQHVRWNRQTDLLCGL